MLLKKMQRDIFQNKMQFFAIFIMVFLGTFLYAGIGGEWQGLQKSSIKYYDTNNAADLWIYGKTLGNTEEKILQKYNGVQETEKRLTISTTLNQKGKPQLELNFITTHQISQAAIQKGIPFDPKKEGIWLDKPFAEQNKLNIGDWLTFELLGHSMSLQIKGLIASPDYLYYSQNDEFLPNHKKNGFAYIAYKELPVALQGLYSQILIKYNTTQDIDTLTKKLEQNKKLSYDTLLTRKEQKSYQTFDSEIQQHRSMGAIFPLIFLLIAMLTVATTMTRLIAQQRLTISTLKAIGFKKRKILFHYLSYSFLLSLLAAFLGAFLGPLVLPPLFYPNLRMIYSLPEWKPAFSLSFLVLPLLLVICCTTITYLVITKFLNEAPAVGMRPTIPKKMKRTSLKRNKWSSKLNFIVIWNLRDLSRNKFRSFMTIFGIVGCSCLLFCAVGIRDSIGGIITWQFDEINRYETQIQLKNTIDTHAAKQLSTTLEAEPIEENSMEIKTSSERRSYPLSIISENQKLIRYLSSGKKAIQIPTDGLAITEKMATLLHLSLGDSVEWHIYGDQTWYKAKISAIFYSPLTQNAVMTDSFYQQTGKTVTPNLLVTKKKNISKNQLIEKIQTTDELKKNMYKMLEMSQLIVSILSIAAILMAIIVLYCLGILLFNEKYTELATLKVLGFQSHQLQKLLVIQTFLLALLAVPFGFAAGYFLLAFILPQMGDYFDIIIQVTVSNVAISGLGTLLLACCISSFFAKRVKKINMVEALKAAE